MCSGFWKGREITGVYCTIRIIFYYILFAVFYSKYHFFYHCWYCMGGREQVGDYLCKTAGWVYVSMWYFHCPLPTCTPLLPAPINPQLCPIFVRKACTHSSLLRFCPDVFFFSVKLKHVILLLNYYPFLCLKVSCWKPSNQIKKKKSEILRSLLVRVKSLYLRERERKKNNCIIAFQFWCNNVVRYNNLIILYFSTR